MNPPPQEIHGAPIAMPWQTILADLALILFLMTAASLAQAPNGPMAPFGPGAASAHTPPAASPRAAPVGVWRDGPGMPGLAQWLGQQGRDPRLRPTILVRHMAGHERAALARAEALVAAAGARGTGARIVIEPGGADAASVVLAYDAE
jgi:hypothetical protein